MRHIETSQNLEHTGVKNGGFFPGTLGMLPVKHIETAQNVEHTGLKNGGFFPCTLGILPV
jgi:hypothetical protein